MHYKNNICVVGFAIRIANGNLTKKEGILDNLNKTLATNLKNQRIKNGLSLDKLSRLTGVSKSMLDQIERMETNPTISTVWKIANGLKISFTELINQEILTPCIIKKEELESITEVGSGYVAYPFVSYEEGGNFEVYEVNIEKGGRLDSDPHHSETRECVIVIEGELTVIVGVDRYVVMAGSALKFKADKKHSYINSTDNEVKVVMIVNYDKK